MSEFNSLKSIEYLSEFALGVLLDQEELRSAIWNRVASRLKRNILARDDDGEWWEAVTREYNDVLEGARSLNLGVTSGMSE